MKDPSPIAVTSRSFSKHPILRAELSEKYSHVRFNDGGISLSGDALVSFLKGQVKAIIALEVLKEEILSFLPDLKVISKFGVGLDRLDLEALSRHKIELSWTPGVNRRSVSELVLGFTLVLLRHLALLHQEVRSGKWQQRKGQYLTGRTIGVVGCGYVGKDLIELLQPFQCRILCHDLREDAHLIHQFGVQYVSLEKLLTQSDVVSLHLPLTETTQNILDKKRLSLMKSTAILINTSRGGLVDEEALKMMLKEERLAGAAFDVFRMEPPTDTELLRLPNFIATPHIGGSTEEGILAMGRAAIAGLELAKPVREIMAYAI
ncbi:MAG: phosphoglycerate dehydrogenase [Chlamydiae bacterium]|nr:phosphoglycerate dehydrogenase [Chlamydiota bacterium]MBI3276228.1 phosphoglycerate dehydrogenase [Chlamydiota bacterium]